MSRSFLPNKDCKHRQDSHCKKTGKRIVLDIRDLMAIKCWNRYYCDTYEKLER